MSDSDGGPGAGFPAKKKTSKAAGKSSKTSGKSDGTSDGRSDGKDRFSQLRDMGLLAKVNKFAEHQVTLACEVSISWRDGFDNDETDEGNWSVMMRIDPSNVDSIYRKHLQMLAEWLADDRGASRDGKPKNDLLRSLHDRYPAIDFTDAEIDTYDHGNDGQLHVWVSYPNGLDLSLPTMKEQAAEIAAYVSYRFFQTDGPVPPKTIDNRKKNGQTYSDSDSDGDSDSGLDFANDVKYKEASRFYEYGYKDKVEDEYLYRLKTDDVHNERWWLENVFDDDPEHHTPYTHQERVYEFHTTITLIKNTRQPLNKQAVVVATQQVLKSVLKF